MDNVQHKSRFLPPLAEDADLAESVVAHVRCARRGFSYSQWLTDDVKCHKARMNFIVKVRKECMVRRTAVERDMGKITGEMME
jgi:hypothetical protein